jgi:Spy/CpxP family protein refolding chaperone
MKQIKKIVCIMLSLISLAGTAQDNRPARENVEAMKIGFLTDRLDLTPEEARKFWPVYNQYSDEMDKLRKSRRLILMEARQNMEEMSDAEAEKFVDSELKFRQDELDIMKNYHPRFKSILIPRKVAKLYKAEEDFKRKLLEMLKDRNDGRGGKRPGPAR